jgi:glycerol-3-phosphate dehydrogenase (NAD(P)+)
MANITVLGAGGFGVSLSVMTNKMGHNVTLWSPFEKEIEEIKLNGENKKLLPNVKVDEKIKLTTNPNCVNGCEMVIFAVPSFAIRQTAKTISAFVKQNTLLVCVSKGFESGTNKCLCEVIKEEIPQGLPVILTGPSHAEEVAREIPTTVVCASENKNATLLTQELLMTDFFRIYLSEDPVGAQLGGALKNVIALAAGVCDGLGFGDNTKAALITRGIAEISRLGEAMGARRETFSGLSGIGDLIVTCTSMHSRNRRAGILIGSGKSVKETLDEIAMTVEGYYACKIAHSLSKEYNVEMPIVSAMYGVLFKNESPKKAALNLMKRPAFSENEKTWF